MRATLSFLIEASSVQKATALRDSCADWLRDQDATVINQAMAQETQTYQASGVDVKTKKPFTEEVDAATPEDAKAKVETATKIVVAVAPES